ncbi:MAG TPA: hypothetical protein VIK15_00960 [Candidatus Anoxymicrobiaceae bacterium]
MDDNGGGAGGKETPDELARLAAENEELKAQLAAGGKTKKHHFWRNFLVWFLIILASLLALAGTLSTWVATTTLNTNTFVKTVAPLVKNDAVAKAVSDQAVAKLFATYDVEGKIKSGLTQLETAVKQAAPNAPIPDINLSVIAGPISSGLQTAAKTISQKILTSAAFYKVWQETIRLAHTAMVNIVEGKQNAAVTSQGNTVVLNLSPLLTQIKDKLAAAGLGFLNKVQVPADFGQIKLFTSDQLGAVKGAVNLLRLVSWLLPLLAFIFYIIAVLIAINRRTALMGAAIALAITMLIVLIVLKVAHTQLFNQMKQAEVQAAANVVWGSLLAGLYQAVRGLLALGIVVAIGAAVAGPYKWSTSLRGHTAAFFTKWRERRQGGEPKTGFYAFVDKYAWLLRIAGLVIAVIVLVALPHISGLAVLIAVIILAVYMAIIELLR